MKIPLKREKVKILQEYIIEKKIDCIILTGIDAKYITGINAESVVKITKTHTYIYLSILELNTYSKDKDYVLKEFKGLKSLNINKKITGLNFKKVMHSTANKFKHKVDISKILDEIRSIKTRQEISKIRIACRITSEILEKTIKLINKKLFTEQDIKRFLILETVKKDCTLAFTPIVASGKNAAIPHAKSRDKLEKGFLIIDFGVKYKGYCADMTRTVFIGRPSKEQIKIYNEVLNIQESAIDKIKYLVNSPAGKLDKFAREMFKDKKNRFIHGLGHSFGLEIHEPPFISPESKDILRENQIITIEPGYYDINKRIGIRIEDDILIKKNKIEVLSKVSKKLKIIKWEKTY